MHLGDWLPTCIELHLLTHVLSLLRFHLLGYINHLLDVDGLIFDLYSRRVLVCAACCKEL